eukprot:2171966-Alexandrium_andersonii.AAC.1
MPMSGRRRVSLPPRRRRGDAYIAANSGRSSMIRCAVGSSTPRTPRMVPCCRICPTVGSHVLRRRR